VKRKHNKKRNTAFLYEVLIKELTKAIVGKDQQKKNVTSAILKEYFFKGSVLARELECYRSLLETTNLEPFLAEKLLHETKLMRRRLDSKNIFDSQTEVISKINKALSKGAWNTFVPNFKSLATISTIFNDETSARQRVLYEDSIVKSILSEQKTEEQSLEPIDNIIYHSFIKKYNEKYTDLLKEQKDLLSKYIASFADNGLDLKLYLNEEVGRLKGIVKKSLRLKEINTDDEMIKKTEEVLEILENYQETEPTQEMISKTLKIQELVREIQSDD
jgi:hypothetical protein